MSRSLLIRLLESFQISLSADSVKVINLCVRKFAHLNEYALLSFLLYLALAGQTGLMWRPRLAGGSIVISSVYALTDELHQVFVPVRGPSFIDCGIDTVGASIAILLIFQYSEMVSKRNPVQVMALRE